MYKGYKVKISKWKYKKITYTSKEFKNVSAHEFGHLLGVDDMYKGYDEIYGPSIFYNEKYHNVTSQDIEMVLIAYILGYFVTWGGAYYV